MRLIDADSVKRGIEELKQSPWYNEKNLDHFHIRKEAVEAVEHLCIDKEPTMDAVEVVRCKDCRFYRFYDGTFGKGWMCFENNTARHGDDYCSRGRKKNDKAL